MSSHESLVEQVPGICAQVEEKLREMAQRLNEPLRSTGSVRRLLQLHLTEVRHDGEEHMYWLPRGAVIPPHLLRRSIES